MILLKYIIPTFMVVSFVFSANAAVKIKNSTADRYAEAYEMDGTDDSADIATLENDIRILDEEIEKCKKQKKGWIAATVIGAAGTVATGVAAGVQGAKLKEAKETKEFKQGEYAGISKKLEETTAEKTKLTTEIDDIDKKTNVLIENINAQKNNNSK